MLNLIAVGQTVPAYELDTPKNWSSWQAAVQMSSMSCICYHCLTLFIN